MTDLPTESISSTPPSPTSLRASRLANLLPTLAGGVLTVATIVGFALHFAGEVAYSTYLSHMGIQPSSFPQAADWKIIHGLFVALDQSTWFVEYMPLKRIAVVLMIVTLPLVVAGAPAKQNPGLRHWLMGIPYWVRQPFVVYFFLVAVLASAAAIGSLLLLSSTMPGVVGERFGASEAAEHVERLERGKFKAISELWKDDQRQMRGEIIVTGVDLIAVYDMDSMTMRTISRDGIEVRARLGLAAGAGTDSTPGSQ
ncbi:TPA: hypothetical protein UM046_000475 [Stenotrophomonas maltophilia]|nr:hypothetical protein [Stenotrophomonas maltophilia]